MRRELSPALMIVVIYATALCGCILYEDPLEVPLEHGSSTDTAVSDVADGGFTDVPSDMANDVGVEDVGGGDVDIDIGDAGSDVGSDARSDTGDVGTDADDFGSDAAPDVSDASMDVGDSGADACSSSCIVGAKRCSSDEFWMEECMLGMDGCARWNRTTRCPDQQRCDPAQTTCVDCPTTCTAGDQRCTDVNETPRVQNCIQTTADVCPSWSSPLGCGTDDNCCDTSAVCSASSPACTACGTYSYCATQSGMECPNPTSPPSNAACDIVHQTGCSDGSFCKLFAVFSPFRLEPGCAIAEATGDYLGMRGDACDSAIDNNGGCAFGYQCNSGVCWKMCLLEGAIGCDSNEYCSPITDATGYGRCKSACD